MADLPAGLRWYLYGVYAACLVLVLASLASFERGAAVWHASPVILPYAAIFLLLTYAGERTTLQVAGSVAQTLATAVHIAVILLFPAPFPLLITALSAAISQALHGRPPLCKRLFNVCHPTIVVGISSAIFSHLAAPTAPTALLHPGHVLGAIPALALLTALYYILDTASMLALLSLLQGLRPWQVWWQSYRRPLLPELAACTIGIIAAVAWRYDPVLLALFVLPVVALRVAFRAIMAEERAASLRRRSEQLEAVLAAGQHLSLQHTRIDLMQRVAEAARAVSGASTVAAYLQDEENPALLRRIGIIPDHTGEPAAPTAPAQIPVAACARGISETEGAEPTVLVPLELEGAGTVGLLSLDALPEALE